MDKETGENFPIFFNNDDILGEVHVKLRESASFDHLGITIELIGIISKKSYLFYILATQNEDYKSEFLNMSKELEAPGELSNSMSYNFSFKKVNLPYESYEGSVFVKYLIRVHITKKLLRTKYTIDKKLVVYNPCQEPELNANVRMEVGICNLIHMEYELFSSKFELKDCILGKIYFVRVSMKVKSVEIHLLKKETINQKTENTLITKFEVVDGRPDADDIVPIRMFLNCYELSPTYRDINNIMSIKYYLKFVIIDDDDKAFFKQQEIFLWRKNI